MKEFCPIVDMLVVNWLRPQKRKKKNEKERLNHWIN